LKNKKSLISIALVLLLAVSAFSFVAVLPAKAATTYPTYAFVSAAPNPAGINQQVYVMGFLDRYPPANMMAGYAPWVLWDFRISITDPSGQTTTKQVTSDTIGGGGFVYTPTQLGTYTIRMHFQGAGPVAGDNNNTYQPSDSNTYTLVVQEQPATGQPLTPLPTGYWQRPIESENREWNVIAGSWLGLPSQSLFVGSTTMEGVNVFQEFSKAPNSAHIVWTKPLKAGGLVGGSSQYGFYTGDSYERQDIPAFIMNGILYHNLPLNNNPSGNGFEAVDLRTGETLWTSPNGSITFGQLLNYETRAGNQHGIIPYLWNSQLQVFDANTGKFLLQFANVTSGLMIQDERGNLLSWKVDYMRHTMWLWNSTQALLYGGTGGGGFGAGNPDYWRPSYGPTSTYNWLKGIMWNVTIPDLSSYGVPPGTGGFMGDFGLVITNIYDDVAIARWSGGANATYPVGYVVYAGYSMTDGSQLWVKKWTDINIVETGALAINGFAIAPGMFMNFKQETEQWHAYSTQNGELLWTTEPYTNPWGTYFTTLTQSPGYYAYGNLYTMGYSGNLYCYDTSNGHLKWTSLGISSGTETPYGSWPSAYMAIADGKVYVSNGEHSPNHPLYRGYELYCVDANTGDLLWKTLQYAESPMIADGYLVDLNGYDMQHYCFGKGNSATTVQAPLTAIPAGDTVTITGTVTDQSPGDTCLGIPAAGTPAISDDSMSAWMEYLYMSKAIPTNATGVSVNLVALDSNGGSTPIGTATSNSMGFFNTHWTVPTTPGDYQIIADFAGTNSYFASSAIAAITVVAAAAVPASASEVATEVVSQLPVVTPVPTAPSASDVASQVVAQMPTVDNTMLIAIIAAVVVAILIGVVNLALLARKK